MNLIRSRQLATGAPRIPGSQMEKIVDRVIATPRMQALLGGLAHLGIGADAIKKSALRKLAPLTLRKGTKPTASAAAARARVARLEKELAAQPNPVLQTEIRRKLAFARLEAKGGSK